MRMLVALLVLGTMLFTPTCARAQTKEYAPYSALFWDSTKAPGDILVNEVRPTIATPTTYYNVLGWLGGYTGLQLLADGKPAFIFSLWDPVGTDKAPSITASASLPGGTVSRFGGEGTGLHYMNQTTTWQVDHWYRFVVRCWDVGERTRFSLWTQDETTGVWTHHVTMETPQPHFRFTVNLYSFLEDWSGTAEKVRRVEYRHPSIHYATGEWQVMNKAFFQAGHPMKPSTKYAGAYDSGFADDHFYVQTGGATKPSLPNSSFLLLPKTAGNGVPSTPVLSLTEITAKRNGPSVKAEWNVDDLTTPPFRYKLEIFGNADASGGPLAASQGVLVEARRSIIPIPVDAPSELFLRITASDLFDREITRVVRVAE